MVKNKKKVENNEVVSKSKKSKETEIVNSIDKEKLVIERIEQAIDVINKNQSNLYFFVIDSNNVPNSKMEYIYQLAYTLKEKGYNITMTYQIENEYTKEEIDEINSKPDGVLDQNRIFTGVGEWLGEEYSSIKHMNIMKEEWKIGPSDFLFIPEVFSSLMYQIFKLNLPCKTYIILENYNYISEFIPLGVEWANYGIQDVIAITQAQADMVKEVFPYVNTKILNPYIPDYFRKPVKANKLIVNLIVQNQDKINQIIKPFYWKYPTLRFISFRDLRNFPRAKYAELLKEGAITIWVDPDTSFGQSPLEAMRCGNVLISKLPENVSEWMINKTEDGDKLSNNCIWFTNINDVPELLSNVILAWIKDEIPEEVINDIEKTNKLYTYEKWSDDIDTIFKEIKEERINQLNGIKDIAKNNLNKKQE